jgi:hypothetical protein
MSKYVLFPYNFFEREEIKQIEKTVKGDTYIAIILQIAFTASENNWTLPLSNDDAETVAKALKRDEADISETIKLIESNGLWDLMIAMTKGWR